MRARCLIRDLPHYRRDAFAAGLEANGFSVNNRHGGPVKHDDILVIWNRYGRYDKEARIFESKGCAVIVAENGYLPHRDTKKAFALALNFHNGAGRWPSGLNRRDRLNVTLKPWRTGTGKEVLLLPQRGIGPEGVAMPKTWEHRVLDRMRKRTKKRVRVRRHPGTAKIKPVEKDLDGVHCAVTWGSGAALKAMIEGVPVFHEFDRWIGCFGASMDLKRLDHDIPAAFMGSREEMLERIACAQWSVEEVITGEPFRLLLDMHETRRAAA